MKKEEIKRLVLKEWRAWQDKNNPLAPLQFYQAIKDREPDLMSFKCSGDRYQVVAGWISSAKV